MHSAINTLSLSNEGGQDEVPISRKRRASTEGGEGETSAKRQKTDAVEV